MQGNVGKQTGKPVNIYLNPEATIFQGKLSTTPCTYIDTLNRQVYRLEDIVFLKIFKNDSKWYAPRFIIPN